MKLAFTVATPDTADENMLALRGPVERSFETLSRHKYSGVDLMIRDPKALDAAAIARAARDYGLEIRAISTGQLRKEDGLSLNDRDEARRRAAVDRVCEVIDFAAEFGAQVNIGAMRGHMPPGDREPALEAARRSFARILGHGLAMETVVAVEPQCRWVINWLNTIGETLEWLAQWAPNPEAPILFDLYHAELEEPSVPASLMMARGRISWVQVSDSNRQAPGRGHWSFADTIRMLQALDYDDYLCVECLPLPDATSAAESASRYLRGVLAGLAG
jgi:sugar phosphate isomerase/epimerase